MTAVMPVRTGSRTGFVRSHDSYAICLRDRRMNVGSGDAEDMARLEAVDMMSRHRVRQPAVGDRGVTHRTYVMRRLMVVLFAAALAWSGWNMIAPQHAQSATGAVSVVAYTVQSGDTLWSYASEVTPRGGDVSETVHELKVLNNLQSSALHPGQTLLVPAQ